MDTIITYKDQAYTLISDVYYAHAMPHHMSLTQKIMIGRFKILFNAFGSGIEDEICIRVNMDTAPDRVNSDFPEKYKQFYLLDNKVSDDALAQYLDIIQNANNILKTKGATGMSNGYIYAPYIPLQHTTIINGPISSSLNKVSSRYNVPTPVSYIDVDVTIDQSKTS